MNLHGNWFRNPGAVSEATFSRLVACERSLHETPDVGQQGFQWIGNGSVDVQVFAWAWVFCIGDRRFCLAIAAEPVFAILAAFSKWTACFANLKTTLTIPSLLYMGALALQWKPLHSLLEGPLKLKGRLKRKHKLLDCCLELLVVFWRLVCLSHHYLYLLWDDYEIS